MHGNRRLIGSRFVVLAVLLAFMLLTYGGVSLFIVVFIMYPMGCEIYRAANIPRTLLPSAIAFGSFGITMTSIPGTPQIQNLIPMEYFGTSAAAAPLLGIATRRQKKKVGDSRKKLYLTQQKKRTKKFRAGCGLEGLFP